MDKIYMFREFIERDDEKKYGVVPDNWGNDFSQKGYISEPQNLTQKVIIDSAISLCKSYCKENDIKNENDLLNINRKTLPNIPYVLPNLKSREMSSFSKGLLRKGFVRVAIKIGGYKEDTGEHREKLYEIHLYLNPLTHECIHPKIKNQGWSRPKGIVGFKKNENILRKVIRNMLFEMGDIGSSTMSKTRYVTNADDRRFSVSALSKDSMRNGDISQSDAVQLMSASTGFFQTLVDAIRFGFLTREEVNRICDSLSTGCEDNFKSLSVTHPCLKWWKNDVSKIAQKIGEDSAFKQDFCESIKVNCEMVKSNYSRAAGNIRQIQN